jgi:hypothetical protein
MISKSPDEILNTKYQCSDLLPEPGPRVVKELIDEIRRLRKSLNYIVVPYSLLEDESKSKGLNINTFAVEIATDIEFLKQIAIKTLQGEPLYV